jgi:hypothetical protein
MNNFSKVITTFTICKFIEEATKTNKNINKLFEQFFKECQYIGGDPEYFSEIATRELKACRLLEQEGGGGAAVGATSIANSVGGGGVAGMKPEDLAIPVEVQKRHTAKNSIFRRKKPNKYYTDKENSY